MKRIKTPKTEAEKKAYLKNWLAARKRLALSIRASKQKPFSLN